VRGKGKVQTEILYGIHPVLEALKAGRRNFFAIDMAKKEPSKRFDALRASAESRKVPVKKVASSQLHASAGTDQHQGITARVSPYPLVKITDIVDRPESKGAAPFLLLLDKVVDPHNLGALIRTALGVGINGVIIPRRRSASPTPAVSKVSAGALEHIQLTRVANIAETIKALQKKGIWVAGMDRHADTSIFVSDLTGPIAIVIGGEEKGIRPLVKKHCDMLMSIPQTGVVNSLNASVAGAVSMYEAFRQREAKKKGRR